MIPGGAGLACEQTALRVVPAPLGVTSALSSGGGGGASHLVSGQPGRQRAGVDERPRDRGHRSRPDLLRLTPCHGPLDIVRFLSSPLARAGAPLQPLRSGLSIVSGRDGIRQPVGAVGKASPSESDAYLISCRRAALPGIAETLIVSCQAVRSHRHLTIEA